MAGRTLPLSPIETPSLDEEMPFIAEVIKGGRLTIPEEIRKLMRINEGNYVLIKLKVVSRKRLGAKKIRNHVRSSSRNGST
jgi:bifunctional DNA-binding transcriptional regulator/antitoxin component of YhaV-PrlF toxin-antitoxin module